MNRLSSALILGMFLACAAPAVQPAAWCLSAPDISSAELTGMRIIRSWDIGEIELEGLALPAKVFEPVIDPDDAGKKTLE